MFLFMMTMMMIINLLQQCSQTWWRECRWSQRKPSWSEACWRNLPGNCRLLMRMGMVISVSINWSGIVSRLLDKDHIWPEWLFKWWGNMNIMGCCNWLAWTRNVELFMLMRMWLEQIRGQEHHVKIVIENSYNYHRNNHSLHKIIIISSKPYQRRRE